MGRGWVWHPAESGRVAGSLVRRTRIRSSHNAGVGDGQKVRQKGRPVVYWTLHKFNCFGPKVRPGCVFPKVFPKSKVLQPVASRSRMGVAGGRGKRQRSGKKTGIDCA